MNDKKLPVGVFDSGLGGISVLRELVREMPFENYLYFGDSANAPYGRKSHDEIFSLTLAAVEKLRSEGIKALVVACNTATGVAAAGLREMFPDMPIIGLEPALKPAVECGAKIIAVLATPATLAENKFKNLYEKFKNDVEIILIPAPVIVEFVENGIFEGDDLNRYLEGLFEPYRDKKIDAVVLGCTHFPFVKDAIKRAAGGAPLIFDGGKGAAAETRRRLSELGLLNCEGDRKVNFENSLDSEKTAWLENMLLNKI